MAMVAAEIEEISKPRPEWIVILFTASNHYGGTRRAGVRLDVLAVSAAKRLVLTHRSKRVGTCFEIHDNRTSLWWRYRRTGMD
jgi:hypothetical protein